MRCFSSKTGHNGRVTRRVVCSHRKRHRAGGLRVEYHGLVWRGADEKAWKRTGTEYCGTKIRPGIIHIGHRKFMSGKMAVRLCVIADKTNIAIKRKLYTSLSLFSIWSSIWNIYFKNNALGLGDNLFEFRVPCELIKPFDFHYTKNYNRILYRFPA